MKTNRRNFIKSSGMLAAGIMLGASSDVFASEKKGTLNIGFLEGANSVAITLLANYLPGYNIRVQSFQDIPTITSALLSNDIQVAQNIYTGFVSMIDKQVPVKAISGQCNGGSNFILRSDLNVEPGNWDSFTKLVDDKYKNGSKLTIASFFGSVQDIELRLLLAKKNIDLKKIKLINVPYPGMAGALSTNSAQAAVPVQPFGAEIILEKIGYNFAYPYDQPAGDLTNLVLMNKKFIENNKLITNDVAKGMVLLTSDLKSMQGKENWSKVIKRYSNVSDEAIKITLNQLVPSYTLNANKIYEMAVAMHQYGFISQPLSMQTIREYIDYGPLELATGKTYKELQ
jgi:ABC-type nitrate/sulfonate/bicarbonate transport system substrate-binding protein